MRISATVNYTVFLLVCCPPAESLGQNSAEIVPDDTCIIDLTLPSDATVSVQGSNYGTKRRLVFRSQRSHVTNSIPMEVRYRSGVTTKHMLQVSGGRLIRFSDVDPKIPRPQLELVTGHSRKPVYALMDQRGSHIITHTKDFLMLWRRESGESVSKIPHPSENTNRIVSVKHVPDSELLFLVHSPKSRKGNQYDISTLWNWKTGTRMREINHYKRRDVVVSSNDGLKVAGTGPDGKGIAIWQGESSSTPRVLTESMTPRSLLFSPDDQVLVSGGYRKVQLWDVSSSEQIGEFEGPSGRIETLALSPDTKYIVAGSSDGAIVWDIASKETHMTINSKVRSAVFGPNGRFLLTADASKFGWLGKKATLWDLTTGKEVCIFEKPARNYSADNVACSFNDDGSRLVIQCGQKSVELVNTNTGKKIATLAIEGRVVGCQFLSGKAYALSIDDFGYLSLIDVVAATSFASFRVWSPEGPNTALGIGPHDVIMRPGTLEAWHTLDKGRDKKGEVRAFDLSTGKPTDHLSNCEYPVSFSSDGGLLLARLNHEKEYAVLDLALGNHTICQTKSSGIPALSPDRKYLATTEIQELANEEYNFDFVVTVHAVSSFPRKTCEFRTSMMMAMGLGQKHKLLFSPDSRFLALFGQRYHGITVWDLHAQKQIFRFEGICGSDCAFHPNKEQLLVGTSEDVCALFDLKAGRPLRIYTETRKDTPALTLSNRQLADWFFRIGLTEDNGEFFRKVNEVVKEVRFCKNGTTFFSDNTLWDTTSSQVLRRLPNTGYFSSDDKWILVNPWLDYWQLYDTGSGQHVVTVNGADQLVVTPLGLFDGNPSEFNRIRYRLQEMGIAVPVERFFQDFYSPGLLASIIEGNRPLPAVAIGKQVPPSISIISPNMEGNSNEDIISVTAVVEDKGGGIKQPWILHNGANVSVDSKPTERAGRLHWDFELPLADGENQIEVHSASADGSWESEPARISFYRATSTNNADLYLLSIGVSSYADETHDLEYAAADASALASLFESRGASSYGEDHVHVQSLLNGDATRKNIEKAISQIADSARPEDVFILTLSGHGIMVKQRYYFLTHEFTSKSEGNWEQDVRRHGLPGDLLQTWINQVPALKRVVVYDTCQSGGAVAVAGLSRNSFQFQRAFETFRRSTGCHVIAAATASQNAEEIHDIGHGALTYALLAGLGAVEKGPLRNRRAETKDGIVDVRNWLAFAQDAVPDLTKLYYGREQLVDVFGEGRSFPILRMDSDRSD